MGPHGPVYPVLVALVPLLRIFRYPSKALLVVAFLLALAAGLGLAAIRRGRHRRATRASPGSCSPAASWRPSSAAAGGPWTFRSWRWPSRGPPPPWPALAARGRIAPGLAAPVLAALAVADLLGAHVGLNPTAPPSLLLDPPPLVAQVDRSEGRRLYVYDYHSLPETSQRLLGRPHPYSYLTPPPGWDPRVFVMVALRLYLLPPSAGFYGLEGSYDIDLRGLYPRELDDLTHVLRQVEGQPAHAKLLRLGAVGTVASLHDGGFGDPVTTLASLFPEPIRVWRVPGALPRAWVVGCARQADRRAAFEAFLDPGFDPAGEVILSEPVTGGSRCGPAGTSRFLTSRPDRVRLEVEAERAGYVVLADAFDPGWRATVDAAAAPLLRANVAFRAIAVPAGRHVVEMVYRPRAVSLGLALTLLTMALVAVAAATRSRAVATKRGRERRPQPIGRTTRAGTPATSVRGGTSAVTTLPAATNDSRPTRTPGSRVTFAPTKAPDSTTTGAAAAGKWACSGWSAKPTFVWVSTRTRSAKVTCRSRRTASARSRRHSSPRKQSSPISSPASPRR